MNKCGWTRSRRVSGTQERCKQVNKSRLGLLLTFSCFPAFLGACVPVATSTPSKKTVENPSSLKADFADQGVVWTYRGKTCVVRVPNLQANQAKCPRLPKVADVAWHRGEAWAALPSRGLVVTLDGVARSVSAGKAVLLTKNRIYREDGSGWSYDNQPVRGVLGRPEQIVTGGDGQDYALLAGQLRRVDDGAWMGQPKAPLLVATPERMATVLWPSVLTRVHRYQLRNGFLERLNLAGQVLNKVRVDTATARAVRLGLVRQTVVVLLVETEQKGEHKNKHKNEDKSDINMKRFTLNLVPVS